MRLYPSDTQTRRAIGLSIPVWLYQDVKVLAIRRDTTVAELVQKIMREEITYYNEMYGEPTIEEIRLGKFVRPRKSRRSLFRSRRACRIQKTLITPLVPSDLYENFRILAVRQGYNMTGVLVGALCDQIEEFERKYGALNPLCA
jgi:hypothetical protein